MRKKEEGESLKEEKGIEKERGRRRERVGEEGRKEERIIGGRETERSKRIKREKGGVKGG